MPVLEMMSPALAARVAAKDARPVTKAEPKTAEHDGPGVMHVVVVAIYLYGILSIVTGVGYYWFRHYGFSLPFQF